jgi:hypothetical protein
MKATISEIVPESLNVSFVAFSFDPPPSGLGRLRRGMTGNWLPQLPFNDG